MAIIINLLLVFVFVAKGFCDEAQDLGKIVVKSAGTNYERADSLKNNYSLQTVDGSEIKENNPESVADVLNYVSGMDLRYRSGMGVQGDLSLRGSTYEQVAVLIDGVAVNDPQTGHYSLDIPLTAFDVEKVEVLKEPASSLYGPNALAGSVNIITKKPDKQSLQLDSSFGQHALFGQAFSLSIPNDNLSGRLSFDHDISQAARPNTDFQYYTTSLYLNRKLDNLELDTLFGYQKKDYGADSFYSNLFNEEEEHTETIFIKTGFNLTEEFGSLENNLFLRRHKDKFILERNDPTSVNYHTTYVYGFNSNLDSPLEYGDLLCGLDLGEEEINSTNLGQHQRPHGAGSAGFVPYLGDRLSLDSRARLDYYQDRGWNESFNLGAGYVIIDQKLKLKSSLARSFRIPSFTELYYSDPANIGNPNLKTEKTDSVSLGINFIQDFLDFQINGFYRRGKNLIDWVRQSTSDPWSATNLGRVDYRGIEFSSKINTDLNFRYFNLQDAVFSYNYISPDEKATGFISKYALDVLQHQYILDLNSRLMGLNFNWQLSYNQRYYGETYFIGNLYIGKRFPVRDFIFEPYIKIDNLTNTKYSQISGVLEPGRWIKGGLKFEW